MSYVVIAFHTDDDRYNGYAANLRASVEALGLPYDIKQIPALGSWLKGTNYKSTFVAEMQEKYPENDLLYVDADSSFKRRPVLFDKPYPHDVGLFLRPGTELHAATIYLRSTPNARMLVKCWKALQDENPRSTDQSLLQKVVNLYGKGIIDVGQLPHAYCCKFDVQCAEPVVIEQYQASRKASSRT
jgi:hypothetical protein